MDILRGGVTVDISRDGYLKGGVTVDITRDYELPHGMR